MSAVGLVTAVLAPQPVAASTGENGLVAVTKRVRDEGGDRWAQVWTMRQDGTEQRMLFASAQEDNASPAWSPDGRWLAFTRNGQVMVARPDGTEVRLLDTEGAGPMWSPDGTRLVYGKDRDVWTVNADGSDPHRIIDGDYASAPTWSPTGDLIAFTQYDNATSQYRNGDSEIHTYNTDTGDIWQLTFNNDPLDDHISPVDDFGPVWSPDGTKILFTSTRDAPLDCLNCSTDMYLMNADGSDQRRFAADGNEYAAAWSPDGTTILFMTEPTAPHSQTPWLRSRDVATGAVTKIMELIGGTRSWGARPGSMALADLRASIASDAGSYAPGATATYEVAVTNDGPQRAADARLEVTLPDGANYLSSSGATCLGSAPVVRCRLGGLAPAASVTITVAATVGSPGTGAVAAMATSDTADPDIFNNRRVTTVVSCTQQGGGGADTLTGTEGDDVLCGGGGADQLLGGGGNDLLLPGRGTDTVDGGAGTDTVSYAAATTGVRVDLVAQQAVGEGTDTLAGVENAEGSRFDDALTGSAGANVLTGAAGSDRIGGGPGADRLVGGSGRDVFIPGAGDDHLVGGAGMDTVNLSASPAAVTVNLATGVADGPTLDSLVRVEAVVGSRFADVLRGSLVQNQLTGGRGPDQVYAMGSNDALSGGRGADDLVGGDGNDSLAGGRGIDRCAQKAGTGTRTRCER